MKKKESDFLVVAKALVVNGALVENGVIMSGQKIRHWKMLV